jgi:predicted adenylyl cyclase CyaB
MARNVEIKARVSDLTELEHKVRQLAEHGPQHLTQTDTFFHALHGRLKLREFGDGSAELIAYSRADQGGPKISSYQRAAVQDPAALKRALAGSNGMHLQVRKTRTVYLAGQTRVHLDRVEGLGDFMELEVVLTDQQTAQHGEAIAQQLMQALGISTEQLIHGAYADLLAQQHTQPS